LLQGRAASSTAVAAGASSALMSATNSLAALTLPAWPTGMSSGAQLRISSPCMPLGGLPGDMLLRAQAALPSTALPASHSDDDALNVALDAFAKADQQCGASKRSRPLDDPWAEDPPGEAAGLDLSQSEGAILGTELELPTQYAASRPAAQPAIDEWFVTQRLQSFRAHIEAKATTQTGTS
jgi:hypothetical protein